MSSWCVETVLPVQEIQLPVFPPPSASRSDNRKWKFRLGCPDASGPPQRTMTSGLRRGVLRALVSGLWGPAGRWGCLFPPGGSRVPLRSLSGPGRSSMDVFDRQMKKKQKDWAASLEDGHQYDYLRDEVTGPPNQNSSRG